MRYTAFSQSVVSLVASSPPPAAVLRGGGTETCPSLPTTTPNAAITPTVTPMVEPFVPVTHTLAVPSSPRLLLLLGRADTPAKGHGYAFLITRRKRP
jgi:hypothetical protein